MRHTGSAATAMAAITAAAGIGGGAAATAHAQTPQLVKIGGVASGAFSADGGGAEIPAFDPASKRLFVVDAIAGGVDVLDLSNPAAPSVLNTLSFAGFSPNSVAVRNGVLAVAAQASAKTAAGKVLFYRASDGQLLGEQNVGSLPDMLTFSPDGSRLLVANEGEPENYVPGNVDPEGSVSVLSLSYPSAGNVTVGSNTRVGFRGFNGQQAQLNAAGVRVYGPGATVAQDLEPEYIAVSPDGTKAFVTLQENNALATIDLTGPSANTVTGLRSFGSKDHGTAGNGLDASDRDSASNGAASQIKAQPLRGLYMPDSVAAFTSGGQTFLVTANEGDAREYAGFPSGREDLRVSDAAVVLDPTAFPNAATLKGNGPNGIARLRVSVPLADFDGDGDAERYGDTDGDGDLDVLHTLGARSFSVRDAAGNLVFDSGDDIEQIVAAAHPNHFNADHSGSNDPDARSPNKGPEPEGIVIGEAFGRTLLFVGLERQGGVLMYDLADPAAPQFLQYINPRDFSVAPTSVAAGDLGPEGLAFIPAGQSPNGLPLLIVGNEVSGTVGVFAVPEPASGLTLLAGAGLLAMRYRRPR